MHDVLDPRDWVPDEVEQLALSGYDVGSLADGVAQAAREGDFEQLSLLRQQLARLEPRTDWAYVEPDDDTSLLETLAAVAPTRPNLEELPDRLHGAWVGRAVGNTLGKPIEGLTRSQIEIYRRAAGQLPQTSYLPLLDPLPRGVPALHPSAPVSTAGRFTDVPRDDDLDWTILALHVLETHGRAFTTEHLAAAWLDRVPFTQTYTAERAAYRNLVQGLRPPETATHDNPYREWIGALIRGDAFGYISPGDPAEAARLALTDARLSHTANGKYGEMWAAALVAAALAADSADEALRRSLPVVPPTSRLAQTLRGVLDLRASGADHEAALDWVDENLGAYPWVHTINNAALICIGLLWGEDFASTLNITIEGGRDTDSNGATAGSVFGALHGFGSIPDDLVGTTHVRVRSAVRDFDRVQLSDLANRTLRLAWEYLDRPGRSA